MSIIDLEPLVCLKRARMDIERGNCEYNVTDYLDTIEAALLELKSIKEANSSEALKCLESMSNEKALFRSILSRSTVYMGGERIDDFSYKSTIGNMFKGAISIIRQALLEAQELKSENSALLEENNDLYFELALAEKQYKELTECVGQYNKVLEIIKEKEVDTFMLMLCDNVEQYNSGLKNKPNRQLTEEEFDLLKKSLITKKEK